MLKFILLISIFASIISLNERKTFKELIDIYLNKLDFNNAYLTYNQYISLLETLKKDFPNYLDLVSIGKTYNENDMLLIIMKSPINSNSNEEESSNINLTEIKNINLNFTNTDKISNNSNNSNQTYLIDNSLYNKSGIFFNGMHHGKEPISMMMNIYLILHLLSLPKTYLHLILSTTNIYFLPVINIEAFIYNSKMYLKTNSLSYDFARKNMRPNNKKECTNSHKGVDLNRNYDYFFADKNGGSSDNPCDIEYRGEYPFSEPETNNIKNFIDSHPDIKIAINYHSFGNIVITPFNYLKRNKSLEILEKNFPIHYKMYQDFKKEANYPKNFLFGNADKTINYLTNGEATDWYLGKKNILSFSPELGNGEKKSEKFFPDRKTSFDILEKNLYSGLYAIQKSAFFIKSELLKAEYLSCSLYRARISEIFFNNRKSLFEIDNLKDIELKTCYEDEIVLLTKIKMTNYGYGTYTPGIEFNYNTLNNLNDTNNENENRKYFYFLALDLKVNLDDIKSICYWTDSDSLNKTNNKKNEKYNKKNNTEKDNELKIKCASSKDNEIKDMKLFIDTQIKFLESIIVNIQIIVKTDSFIERRNLLKNKSDIRFLENTINNTANNNISNYNNTKNNLTNDLIELYTKKERIIKSENANGEIIEWKFNNPSIIIKIDEFKQYKNNQYIIIRESPFQFILYIFSSFTIMVFFVYTIFRFLGLERLMDSFYRSTTDHLNNNNNNHMRLDLSNGHIIQNYENENQFQNRNNENMNNLNLSQQYQIARDDSEYSDSP